MWVKICGLRNADVFQLPAGEWPDAVGLNFYPKSPRCLSLTQADALRQDVPSDVEVVGVFVNPKLEEVKEAHAACRLDRFQFHGDEPPELLAEVAEAFPQTKLIRAWRMKEDLEGFSTYLEECRRRGVQLSACLIDAHSPRGYGGTGETAPWNRLAREYRTEEWPPLILAGGLKPENVAAAIEEVQPWGVDTASGVEVSPGVKDMEKTRQFIAAARSVRLTGK